MVCRDKVIVLNRVEVKDDFGGSKITFVPTKTIYANVRIFFSQNEDGLQNRQGLSHLEGSLILKTIANTAKERRLKNRRSLISNEKNQAKKQT